MPHLEITEVLLVEINIANNGYQQDSKVLWALIPNRLFGQSLDILPKNFIFLKIFWKDFVYWSIAYWLKFLTARNNR